MEQHLICCRCNNKTSCAIQASNSLFGDPCVGTFKYLDIDYECKESAIPPLTTGGIRNNNHTIYNVIRE